MPPDPRPDRSARDRRNEVRRSLRPFWARPRGQRGKVVHVASTVHAGKARCGRRLAGYRWVDGSVLDSAHPKVVGRLACKLCLMVHEPDPSAAVQGSGRIHLRSELDGARTQCGLPLPTVRWADRPIRQMSLCPGCVDYDSSGEPTPMERPRPGGPTGASSD